MKKWAQITAVFIVGLIGILVFYSLVALSIEISKTNMVPFEF